MTTRLQKQLNATANKRARIRERITKAEDQHKPVAGLRPKHIDATAAQLKAEIRIERKKERAA